MTYIILFVAFILIIPALYEIITILRAIQDDIRDYSHYIAGKIEKDNKNRIWED